MVREISWMISQGDISGEGDFARAGSREKSSIDTACFCRPCEMLCAAHGMYSAMVTTPHPPVRATSGMARYAGQRHAGHLPHSARPPSDCHVCTASLVRYVSAGRGEANVTLGIPRLRELFMTAARSIKTPVMTLPLRPERTRAGAEALASRLRRLRLAEVCWPGCSVSGPVGLLPACRCLCAAVPSEPQARSPSDSHPAFAVFNMSGMCQSLLEASGMTISVC